MIRLGFFYHELCPSYLRSWGRAMLLKVSGVLDLCSTRKNINLIKEHFPSPTTCGIKVNYVLVREPKQ